MDVEVQVRASFVIPVIALMILFHIRANIRMVQTLRVGRVFIAGGQLSSLVPFLGDFLMARVDAAHCHTPAGGQVCFFSLFLRRDLFIHILNRD